jgi:hypothetical protein
MHVERHLVWREGLRGLWKETDHSATFWRVVRAAGYVICDWFLGWVVV